MQPIAKAGIFVSAPGMFFLLGFYADYGDAFFNGHSKIWIAMAFYLGWLLLMAATWIGERFFTWLERKYPWTKL